MIVETIGFCGSGKTTLLQRLKSYGDHRIVIDKPKRPNTLLAYIYAGCLLLKILCLYPRAFILFFGSFRWLLQKILYRFIAYQNIPKDGVFILLDAGLLMPIIEYQTHHNSDNTQIDLDKLLTALPLPDYIFFVNTNYETSLTRYFSREKLNANQQLFNKKNTKVQRSLKKILKILKEKKINIITISEDSKDEEILLQLFDGNH